MTNYKADILYAAYKGDVENLRFLLEQIPSADYKDLYPVEPLSKVEDLHSQGILTKHDFLEETLMFETEALPTTTALHQAVNEGHKSAVALLVDKGFDPNSQTKREDAPLYIAASNGREDIIALLLDKNALVNQKNQNGSTALHAASSNGHRAIAELLLKHGAFIDIQDKYNKTPLHYAVSDSQETVVALLLDKGAAINHRNENGSTALHIASFYGYQAVVELLLEHNARINIHNEDYDTPLHLAAINCYEAILALLLNHGATISLNAAGFTPLTNVLLSHRPNRLKVVQLLLQHGAYSYIDQRSTQLFVNFWKNSENVDIEANISFYTTLLLAGAYPPENQSLPKALCEIQKQIEATFVKWLKPVMPLEGYSNLISCILRVLPSILRHTFVLNYDVPEANGMFISALKNSYGIPDKVARELIDQIKVVPEIYQSFHAELFQHDWSTVMEPPIVPSTQNLTLQPRSYK